MTPRNPEARVFLDNEIVVDSFAGGGGASLGIHWALGRVPDIAINHDAEAIALHRANHPDSKHYVEDIWKVDPVEACAGRPVGLMWLSPDCKHFSKAKGGKPVNKKVRGLAWVAIRWANAVSPRVIVLENVEEFQTWGPVLPDGKPCPKRKGQTFRAFVRKLERLGYVVEWRELRANHYNTPTIRKRLFLIARRDGQPIVWPKPTTGKQTGVAERTAAECIEWALECPSIFDRKKPLAPNTLRRIARGIQRFVIDSPRPFIVSNMTNNVPRDVDDPMSTITGGNRQYLAQPFIAGAGQPPRILDLHKPLGTVVADGTKQALVTSFLAKHNAGHEATGQMPDSPMHSVTARDSKALVTAHIAKHYSDRIGSSADEPLHTVTAESVHHAVVTSHLTNFHKSNTRGGQGDLFAPMRAVLAEGNHIAEVRSFLVSFYGTQQSPKNLNEPAPTIRTKDSLGLVTVEGIDYVIADIGMRMLQPRELYRAQGFPDSYKIDIDYNGKPMTKTAQVRMCGNSVCPPLAAEIIRANYVGAVAGEHVA